MASLQRQADEVSLLASHAKKAAPLQSVTILLIFLIVVINQIFLISLIAVLLKKIKFLIRSNAKKYYYFVIFYIVSKMTLCIFLQVKILSGIPDQFADIQSSTIETVFDNSLAFADCSIVQLFLISFEHYIALSFSIFGSKKTERLIRLLMQGAQLITFLTLMVPLLLFNISLISYETLNIFTMTLNCLSVIVFIAAFFFMNFKMTGLMMEKRSSQIIKKVYALLLALLISRLIMSFMEIWVQVNISNGGFQDFISIIEENQNQYVVLGCCFIVYLLIILLTEGLPLIMSMRESIATALSEVVRPISRPTSFEQSVITESNTDIREELLNNLDVSSDGEIHSPSRQSIVDNYHGVSKIENPDELELVEKILAVRQDFVAYKAKWTRSNKLYFVKKLGNISNYIIEEILNEIESFRKTESKVVNPIKILQKNNDSDIYLIEKYLPQNLLKKMEKAIAQSIKQRINLAIKIALAIGQFHEAMKTGHGSLNPKNVMFDENDNIILTGFGMESLKKYLSLTADYSNITIYTAVELFGSARQKTISKPQKAADVYSFGIIFYQLMSGNFKYRSLSLPEIKEKFLKENTRPKIPEQMQEDLKKLMRKCWQEVPENRPAMSAVLTSLQSIKSHI